MTDLDILAVVPEHPSPTQTFVARLVNELNQRSRVSVLALRSGDHEAMPIDPPVINSQTPSLASVLMAMRNLSLLDVSAAFHIARAPLNFRSGRKWDVAHAHFAGPTLDVALALRSAGVVSKVLVTVHANDIFSPKSVRHLRATLQQADGVVAISRRAADRVRSLGVDPDLLSLIPVGVDPGPATAIRGRDGSKAITVARHVPKKGIDVAVRHLSESREGVQLTIVGDGPLFLEHARLAQEAGVEDVLDMHRGMSNSEVRLLMQSSAIFVLPCRASADGDEDGIPVSMLEAMSDGCVPVVGEVGGIAEVIRHEENGLFVEPTPSSVAAAVDRLIRDEELRYRLALEARRTAAERTVAREAERVESVLATLARGA